MFSYHPVRNGALLSNCLLGIPYELQHLMKFISPRKSGRENRVFLGRARDALDPAIDTVTHVFLQFDCGTVPVRLGLLHVQPISPYLQNIQRVVPLFYFGEG